MGGTGLEPGPSPAENQGRMGYILKPAFQSLVLDYIYNHAHYRNLNFYGGTCLHIIYNLNRLSEDIDLDNSQGIQLDLFVIRLRVLRVHLLPPFQCSQCPLVVKKFFVPRFAQIRAIRVNSPYSSIIPENAYRSASIK